MTFTWGLLGAARIARALIPAIREAGGTVAVLGARDPASAHALAFAREWDIARVTSYQGVLDSPVDAVYVPLPNDLHLPWARRALEAGKHALVEKPLALNAQQAAELADTAEASGRLLQEAFAYRFTPQHEAALRLVRAGELGEIRALRGAFGFRMEAPERRPDEYRWRASQGGGSLLDVGCYPLNFARLLLGEPEAVTAQARWTAGEDRVDLGFSATLQFPGAHFSSAHSSGAHSSGALATLESGFDWLPGGMGGRCHVIGSEGQLELEDAFQSQPDRPLDLIVNGEYRPAEPASGYARMVAQLQAAARGEEPQRYPPADAVAQARVLDALLESAHGGVRVAL